jgi:hypothetical protein
MSDETQMYLLVGASILLVLGLIAAVIETVCFRWFVLGSIVGSLSRRK